MTGFVDFRVDIQNVKTSKKLLKLLQKAVLLCYNDYTINTRDAT